MQENVILDRDNRYVVDYQGLSLGDHCFEWAVDDSLFTCFKESENKGLPDVRLKHGHVVKDPALGSGPSTLLALGSNGDSPYAATPDTDADADSGIMHGRGDVRVRMVRHASMMDLFVDIDARVELECDRCLESYWTDVAFEGELVVKISDEIGEYDGEVMWISPSQSQLDLRQYIYESVVLSLPYHRVHPNISDCNQDMIKRFKIISEDEFDRFAGEGSGVGGIDTPFDGLADAVAGAKKDF